MNVTRRVSAPMDERIAILMSEEHALKLIDEASDGCFTIGMELNYDPTMLQDIVNKLHEAMVS